MAEKLRASWWELYDSWPLHRVSEFDRSIDRFETAWRDGQSPPLEPILDQVPTAERPAWLAELLAVEMVARWESGDQLSEQEFLQRFPGDGETVHSVWAEVSLAYSPVAVAKKPAPAPVQRERPKSPDGNYLSEGDLLDGRYMVERFVLRGGMGELYRAVLLPDRLPVAIKVMRPIGMADDEKVRRRFATEKQILHALRHQHLVSAIEPLLIPQLPPMIVMDWIEGQNLKALVTASGRMPVNNACEVVRQAALGLGYASRTLEMVHRDVKPENLMLTYRGEVKVLDFGLARPLLTDDDSANRPTSESVCLGTPQFMAPEQRARARDVTPAADVYGLGCTLFYLLTKKEPFFKVGREEMALADAHRTLPPPDLNEFRADVPPGLAALLNRMLAKQPQDRPQNGDELAKDLAAWTVGADLQRWITGQWEEPEFLDLPRPEPDPEPQLKPHGDMPSAQPPSPQTPSQQQPTAPRESDSWDRRLFLAAGCGSVGLLAGFAWAFRASFLPPPRVLDFDVTLYRPGGTSGPEKLGVIGRTAFAAQAGNQTQLRLRFDVPCYVQVFSAGSAGNLQLLATTTEDKSSSMQEISGQTEDLRLDWGLDDVQGLQAFVVIASRSPLPTFDAWQDKIPLKAAWARVPNADGVWTSRDSAHVIHAVLPENETPRGQSLVPDALRRMWEEVRRGLPPRAAAALLAFPVKS